MNLVRWALVAALAALSPAAWTADFAAPVQLPSIPAPLSAPAIPSAFPLSTAPQFSSGARAVVDLGGDAYGHWSLALAQAQPQTQVHLVNLQSQDSILSALKERRGLANVQAAQYNFFSPPAGHPTGDRVVLNSPNFGGLRTAQDAEAFAAMIDAHLDPGGFFYAHADDLLYASMHELLVAAHAGAPMSEEIAARHARVLAALRRRFGAENVSEQTLRGYDAQGQLNAMNKFNLQVRKPAVPGVTQ